jgi:CRISPR-associated Csx2 family protein
MTTLISFLGKGREDPNQGYRTARYRFPDGSERTTAYFGLALAEYLKAKRVILIGTASSMWDVLIENVVGDAATEAQRLELMDAVADGRVSEPLLESFRALITRTSGRALVPMVIASGTDLDQQQAILPRLAEHLVSNEPIAMDVTHGYRHLGMLALGAARYLAHTRKVQVDAVYYGALEMTGADGATPVVRLDGLIHLQNWGEALAAYEASGDFSRFAPLLERDGLPAKDVQALHHAWHYLNLTQVAEAAIALRPLLERLEQPLRGAAELFRERLRQGLRWVHGEDLAEQQRLLALQSLRRGDFLRATVYGMEAFLSRETLAAGRNPLDFECRNSAEQIFRQELKDGEHPHWKRNAYWLLRHVRNACAHGTPPEQPYYQELLRNPARLTQELEATLNRLINNRTR